MQPLFLHSALIGISFVCYGLFFLLNNLFFNTMDFSVGVNWIFLPAGLRLLLTLVLAEDAAIGITLASILISFNSSFENDWITGIGAGILSGLAPYITYRLVTNNSELMTNLSNINHKNLFLCIVFFAFMSPLLHQIWFVCRGYTHDFFSSFFVMILGDLLGSFFIIYMSKYIIYIHKVYLQKKPL